MKELSAAELPFSYKCFLVAAACAQNLLGGGLIYGWAGFSNSLLNASPSEGGAGLTPVECTRIFSWATFVNFTSPLVLGFILDSHGPRVCSVLSNAVVALGCVTFSLANGYREYAFGALLIAFGGPGVQNSCIHLGVLFPENQALVMCCITGFMSLSLTVFPIMSIIWQVFGVGIQFLFESYALLLVSSTLLSFCLWPDVAVSADIDKLPERSSEVTIPSGFDLNSHSSISSPIKHRASSQYVHESEQRTLRRLSACENAQVYMLSTNAQKFDQSVSRLSVREMDLLSQLRSMRFLSALTFFVVTAFLANLYVGSVTTQLGDYGSLSPAQQTSLAQLFTFITAFGVVAAPLVGFAVDKVGFVPTALISLSFGILQMMLLLVGEGSSYALVTSFVFFSLFRCFIFRYYFSCLFVRMGLCSYGRLVGISFAVAGLTQPFLNDVARWAMGTCHVSNSEGCDTGHWKILYLSLLAVLFSLAGLVLVTDHIESRRNKEWCRLSHSWQPHLGNQLLAAVEAARLEYGAINGEDEERNRSPN